MEDKLLRLWGKTDKKRPGNYHPLLFHLLDVGHVTRQMWFQALSPSLRRRLASALGVTEEAAVQFVTLLAAQHDLGKASAFQYKDAALWKRLNQSGLSIVAPEPRPPHSYVSAKALPALAQKGIGGWQAGGSAARALAKITGGHHGTFPTSSDHKGIGNNTLGEKEWDDAREDLLNHLAAALSNDSAPLICPLEELTDPILLPLLGGLISVADWIGSSRYFPPAGPASWEQYTPRSRRHAEEALEGFGWMSAPKFAAPLGFRAIFPFEPNPMQAQAAEWADTTADPYLMIIESEMGSGKTEAALYAADRALSTDLARGFYIALPTQATGNAMFRRVQQDYFEKRGHGGVLNLQLVHAGALLSEEFETLRQAADALHDAAIYDDVTVPDASAEEEGIAGRLVAEDWFAARKRPLLARFGVGTIDQSLLGVLQTRHWFVRLMGLAGKVIVFDEVHAYDVYMSKLLCRLLAWLRVLDCTVILLSATLPTSARNALLGAWRGDDILPKPADYPRLTLCRADTPPEAVSVADSEAPSKDVLLGWTDPDWESVLGRMRTDLPDGGCALLLCNTVTRAQDAYRTLRPVLREEDWTVKLFHARTPALWRQEREKWVLETFGKDSPKDRREKKVLLIATTIVEQSLDLDFDWIASEIAPGDLILQRMGRLWRHKDRLRSADRPRFVILCGKDADGFPVFPDFAELIYERYILLRSWLAVQALEDKLTLPAAIDPLVQETYQAEMPIGLSDAWQTALKSSKAAMERKQADDQGKAEANTLPGPEKGLDAILDLGSTLDHLRKTLWDDEDPRVHETVRAATRLGDPSIGIVCLGTAENGESLASLSKGEPTLDAARQLLRFGLPLSRPKLLYRLLIDQKPPAAWQDSALLRYHRAIDFTQGRASLGEYDLRLSQDEGLVIEKKGKATEE